MAEFVILGAAIGVSNIALVTFVIYLVLVVLLAWLSSRAAPTGGFVSEYFLGSRNLGVCAPPIHITSMVQEQLPFVPDYLHRLMSVMCQTKTKSEQPREGPQPEGPGAAAPTFGSYPSRVAGV